MHIGGPKRIQQLDDAQEVLITHAADGTPIWTTAGQNRMTGDDKAHLSANLRAQQRQAHVMEQVKKVQAGAAGFLEAVVLGATPQSVLDAYNQGDVATFGQWMQSSGFSFKQDGLTSRAFHNGSEVATFTATVDHRLEQDVLAMLRLDEGISRIEQSSAT